MEILTAIHALVVIANGLQAEIAELKVDIGRTETIDRTDEILAAIRSTALDVGQQTRQALKAIESADIGRMADEMVNLKAEIAELRPPIAPPPAAATRRTKK